jgi:hypothetical protein
VPDDQIRVPPPGGVSGLPPNLGFHLKHWPYYIEALEYSGLIDKGERRPEVIRLALQYVQAVLLALKNGVSVAELEGRLEDNRLSKVGRGEMV